MKNMKIKKKLVVSFLIVIALAIAIGAVGLFGIITLDNVSSDMYLNKASPLGDLATATEYFQRIRVQTRNAIIYSGDAEQLKTVESDMLQRIEQFKNSMREYEPTIASEVGRQLYDEIVKQNNEIFEPGVLDVLEGAKRGEPQTHLLEEMAETTTAANKIADDLASLTEARMGIMNTANDDSTKLGQTLLFAIIAVILISITIAIVLALYIAGLISKPAAFMKDVLMRIGTKGDLEFSDAEYATTEEYAKVKDEIGESVNMLLTTVRRLVKVGDALGTVAAGDLTNNLALLSDRDTMGISLQKMIDNLNNMFSEITSSTNQVSTGSSQIADGAQMLAQGATEQSATVQQLSASVIEVSTQTKGNADMANDARELGESIKVNAETGSQQMEQMMAAVQEINESSKSIGKVIKIIDDIAFQTNILALNAAVEAARAGQHGKGFAVVADEVRSLAAKSAEAAKNTNELIESSIQKAERGAAISSETSDSLRQIVEGILRSSELVSNIASSSNEQSIAISQISDAIDQVSQVVQQNSATAEESAAASEEMSGQAALLKQLISQFKLRDGSMSVSSGATIPYSASKVSTIQSSSEMGMALDGSKY